MRPSGCSISAFSGAALLIRRLRNPPKYLVTKFWVRTAVRFHLSLIAGICQIEEIETIFKNQKEFYLVSIALARFLHSSQTLSDAAF